MESGRLMDGPEGTRAGGRTGTARAICLAVATMVLLATAGDRAWAQEREGVDRDAESVVQEREGVVEADRRPVFSQEVRIVTLEEATDLALRHSPALQQARATVEIAEFDRLGAYGNFLPRLNLGYGYTNSSTGRLDPTGQSITTTSWTMQLGGAYDVFTGFRRFSDLRSARLGVQVEDARYRQREYEALFFVRQAFFGAVAAEEIVRVEEDRVRRQEDQLSFVEQQVQLGRATRSDLLRTQVDLNNARLDLLNAENEARASTFQLAEAVGVEERLAPSEEATLEAVPFTWSRQELETAAMEAAPAVVSAEAATDAAEAGVASARSLYLPSLTFSGGWAWQAGGFPPADRSWQLQLSGNYPLFNGFQRENAVMQARARADGSRAQERAERLALRADVDEAYSRIQVAQAGIDLAEQSVELSRESLRVVQERYRLGLATILDLQQAQITLRESEVALVNRRFDYQLGLAQLESLLGRSLVRR